MSPHTVPPCQHIKKDGSQCGSPALRNRPFCYHHNRRPLTKDGRSSAQFPPPSFFLPLLQEPVRSSTHSAGSAIMCLIAASTRKRLESCSTPRNSRPRTLHVRKGRSPRRTARTKSQGSHAPQLPPRPWCMSRPNSSPTRIVQTDDTTLTTYKTLRT